MSICEDCDIFEFKKHEVKPTYIIHCRITLNLGARRHFYIDKEVNGGAILTPEQQRYLDNRIEAVYHMQYEKDFAEEQEQI